MPSQANTILQEFKCPYMRQCFLRELFRVILAALLAFLGLHVAGCTWKAKAPGFESEVRIFPPTTQTVEVVKALSDNPTTKP